jgi:hypothetical protein
MVVAGLVVVLALCEIYLRVVVGLGDPPLWMADPEIEYLPRPSRTYVRFGNRITYNAHSMRSREFPPRTADPETLRILVVGDSIVNGGAHTDQDALATTLLERWLGEGLGRSVLVGNIAAGSWGPPNYLAYLKRYGLFDADLVVVVVNSRDYVDAPTFEPLDAKRPQRKPSLALQELFDKYLKNLPRYAGWRKPGRRFRSADDATICLDALRELVGLIRSSGAAVLLAQHLKQEELEGEPETGYHEIAAVAKELGIEPIRLGPAFAEVLADGHDPYFDGFHPNERGQGIMAEVLYEPILKAVTAAN